jgi:uncharacterized cofD-like protein
MGLSAKAVVAIGGGPGIDVLLRGLKRYTAELTAVVTTFDASRQGRGDSEETRSADGARTSLLALGADPVATQIMERLFAYRLTAGEEPGGRTFGNLLLSALTDIMGGSDRALEAAAQVLNVQGRVLPLTLHSSSLVAELLDGREVLVRAPLELSAAAEGTGLHGVRLAQSIPALDSALRVIANADIIVLGPTDLYFDVIAPLQLEGVREAIAASSAVKIFICNLLTQRGTTAGWPASRFIRAVLDALQGPANLDYVIMSSTPAPPHALADLGEAGVAPVALDLEECLSWGLDIIARPVSESSGLHYDGEKLARTILFLGGERVRRGAPAPAPARHRESLLVPGILAPRGADT